MTEMRLRYIHSMDFRKSERTGYAEACDKSPALKTLAADDVVLLLSLSRKQLMFVYGFVNFESQAGEAGTHRVLLSRRLRLESGRWNPLMLADYAKQAGLTLDGLKTFDKHYRDLMAERHRLQVAHNTRAPRSSGTVAHG